MKRVVLLASSILLLLNGDSLKCQKRDKSIYCTYFSDRSDNQKSIKLKFHWISPQSPKDDRIRDIEIPPYYGSAYDYRFLPERVQGHWIVKVTRLDSNRSISSSFDINESDDEFFSN